MFNFLKRQPTQQDTPKRLKAEPAAQAGLDAQRQREEEMKGLADQSVAAKQWVGSSQVEAQQIWKDAKDAVQAWPLSHESQWEAIVQKSTNRAATFVKANFRSKSEILIETFGEPKFSRWYHATIEEREAWAAKVYAEQEVLKEIIKSRDARFLQHPVIVTGLKNLEIGIGQYFASDEVPSGSGAVDLVANSTPDASAEEAKQLCDRTVELGEAERWQDVISVCDEVISKFSKSYDGAARTQAARALFNRHIANSKLGREDAFDLSDPTLDLLRKDLCPTVQMWIAKLMTNMCAKASEHGMFEKAIEIGQEMIAQYAGHSNIFVQRSVINAYLHVGNSYADMQMYPESCNAFESIILRYHDNSDVEIQTTMIRAMVNKAEILYRSGKSDQAIDTYNEINHRFKESNVPSIQQMRNYSLQRLQALEAATPSNPLNKFVTKEEHILDKFMKLADLATFQEAGRLVEQESFQAAVPLYDEVIQKYSNCNKPEEQDFVALASLRRAACIAALGRTNEAIAVCKETLQKYEPSQEEFAQLITAETFLIVAIIFGQVNKKSTAIGICNTVINRYAKSTDQRLLQKVSVARELRDEIQKLEANPKAP